MLSAVLKTERAEEVSVKIMNAFVEMQKFIVNNSDIFKRMITVENTLIKDIFKIMITVENTLIKHDTKITKIFDEINPKEFKEKLFYDGQIYDAYSLLINIIRKAKDKIIIDNKELYHIGASLKDLGKKCFSLSKMDNIFINKITNI